MTKQNNDQKNSTTTIATNNIEETATVSESMKDYEDILNQSFRTIKEGDLLSGTILAISDEGITLDIQYFTDGFIPTEEISKDPNFSVSQNYQIGDVVSAIVLSEENENGDVVLSIIEADAILSWDKLKEAMETEK
ncbi:MAG: S1 RNA-binding domain-containing protein, partial [Lachnospiraceae bacterium]|nr:S1 RNA-binding domain-containing protein [Lachnospiraceae bacterium]